jgi:hypothetical protein
MGQGQEESARKMITEAILNGHWLMLQNCHLSLEFCDEIMQTMLDTDEMHPNFRPGFFLKIFSIKANIASLLILHFIFVFIFASAKDFFVRHFYFVKTDVFLQYKNLPSISAHNTWEFSHPASLSRQICLFFT